MQVGLGVCLLVVGRKEGSMKLGFEGLYSLAAGDCYRAPFFHAMEPPTRSTEWEFVNS